MPSLSTRDMNSGSRLSPRQHGKSRSSPRVNPITFDQGWSTIDRKLLKPLLSNIKQSNGNHRMIKQTFKSTEFAHLYSHIYTMCTQKAPHNWSGKLYFEYRRHLSEHLKLNVLPLVQKTIQQYHTNGSSSNQEGRNDVEILRVVDQEWKNHCMYVKWSMKFFNYLNRFYVKRLAVDDLKTVTLKCFKENVYDAIKVSVTKAYVGLVSLDRQSNSSKVSHDKMLERLTNMYLQLGRGTSRVYVLLRLQLQTSFICNSYVYIYIHTYLFFLLLFSYPLIVTLLFFV
jgi:cullin 1